MYNIAILGNPERFKDIENCLIKLEGKLKYVRCNNSNFYYFINSKGEIDSFFSNPITAFEWEMKNNHILYTIQMIDKLYNGDILQLKKQYEW